MSKSRGNVVSPDTYIDTYGSDVFRLYLMFGFDYTAGGPWDDNGIKSIAKFTDKIERLVDKVKGYSSEMPSEKGSDEKELLYAEAYAVKNVDRDMNNFSFNTAVARLMEFVTAINKYDGLNEKCEGLVRKTVKTLVLLIAPCAPHFAEELWEILGGTDSVFNESYPEYDEKALVKDEVELAVQINSKVKGKIVVSKDASDDEIKEAAVKNEFVAKALDGKQIVKAIVVKGRLINLIVK